jgi:hypothetical protein
MKDTHILWDLRVEDMVSFYDEKRGVGSWLALNEREQSDFVYRVQSYLGHGLGEAWSDYMYTSVDCALEESEENV